MTTWRGRQASHTAMRALFNFEGNRERLEISINLKPSEMDEAEERGFYIKP